MMVRISNHNEGEGEESPTPEEEKAMLEKGRSEGFEGQSGINRLIDWFVLRVRSRSCDDLFDWLIDWLIDEDVEL